MGRVIKFNEIAGEIQVLKDKKLKIIFTNGCFDLLHVGHVRYLQEAQRQGDILMVGINSDRSVKQLKGLKRPIQNESDRAEILAALSCVQLVSIFDEPTPFEMIHLVRPDVLVKGGDWPIDKIIGAPFVQSYGGKVCSLQFVEGKSTTKIIEKMNA